MVVDLGQVWDESIRQLKEKMTSHGLKHKLMLSLILSTIVTLLTKDEKPTKTSLSQKSLLHTV